MGSEKATCTVSPADGSGPELELDALYSVLADPVRRLTLFYLVDREVPVQFEGLSSFLADSAYVSADTREVQTALVHQHLPTLESAGLVEFDRETGRIRYNAYPVVEAHLSTIEAATSASE